MKTVSNKNVAPAKKRPSKISGTLYPEDVIVKLARTGQLAKAGEKAIEASHKLGLSVTVMEDGAIYSLHPDGTRTLIKKMD